MAGGSKKAANEDRFVEEYLVDLNAARAYRAAHPGVTDATARVEGSKLLARPKVQEKIRVAKAERAKRTRVTQDRVVRELARVAFFDLRVVYDDDGKLKNPAEFSGNAARAVASIEVDEIWTGRGEEREIIGHTRKLRPHNKIRALEILLAHVNAEAAQSKGGTVSFADLMRRALEAKKRRESGE